MIFYGSVLLMGAIVVMAVRFLRPSRQGRWAQTYQVHPIAPVRSYKIVNVYPHDPKAYTQGLVWHEGFLYESTGLYGESTLRRVELETGRVVQIQKLEAKYFAEGLALWRDRLIQLTWREHVAFLYDLESFEKQGEFHYDSEGWGLTHDGTRLILSDGTAVLTFLDPENDQPIGRVLVHDGPQTIRNLNELEYIHGEVLANVWMTNWIARIDPENGKVLSWLDLSGLARSVGSRGQWDLLNGIAYDEAGDRLFVTGKRWPKLFEIKIEGEGS
jgi:glutaminyl-peptide cyclotransferase